MGRRIAHDGFARTPASAYLMNMRRSRGARLFALMTALVASLSAPGVALSHGYAHHEAHEHAETAHADPSGIADDHAAAAESAGREQPSDHGHPEIAGCVCARFTFAPVGLLSAHIGFDDACVTASDQSTSWRSPDRPPAASHPPPLHSRAPPALI